MLPLLATLLACAPPDKVRGDSAAASVDTGSADTARPADSETAADTDTAADSDTAQVDADGDGYSPADGDCDETNPAIHPGADEACDDWIDNDCDGAVDNCTLSLSTVIEFGPGYGMYSSMAGVGDVNSDGYDDFLVGSYSVDEGTYYAGAAYLVLGSATPAGGLPRSAVYAGTVEEAAVGEGVAGAGDVNGDGYDDMLIGSPSFGDCQGRSGAYLVLGSAEPASAPLGGPEAIFYSGAHEDRVGVTVSGGGDVNGDGFDDLLIGVAPAWGSSTPDSVAIVLGGAAPASESIYHEVNYTGASVVASAGDVDGDGFDDIVAGGESTWLVLGATTLASDTLASGVTWNVYAQAVAGAGDVNGDGYSDVLVGEEGYDSERGGAYLFLGDSDPSSVSVSASPLYTGESLLDCAGSVSGAGDVDADGYDDFLVGAACEGDDDGYHCGEGAVYLVFGSASPASASLSTFRKYTGESPTGFAGYLVSGAGDVNGDGYADMLASGMDTAEDLDGAAYLILGASRYTSE